VFKYFGSKYRDAFTYQPPQHGVIIEPFAGAAAYAMRWMSERSDLRCVLVERDPDVAALWRRLLSMTPQDIMDIPPPVAGERTDDLLIALSASAASPLGSFKTTGDAQITTRQVTDFRAIQPRVAMTRALVGDRVEIIEGDYTDAPDIEGTWFIDPPYQHQGHRYAYGSELIDYQDLAEWVLERRGQIIVCEAAPADWLPFRPHKSSLDQNTEPKIELVWESHPTPTLLDLMEA
jgi:hypothetical protein